MFISNKKREGERAAEREEIERKEEEGAEEREVNVERKVFRMLESFWVGKFQPVFLLV